MSYPATSLCLALMLSTVGAPAMAQQLPAKPAVVGAPRSAAPTIAAPTRATPAPIAKSAFLLKVESEFISMDANKDGRLTKDEVERFRSAAIATRRREQNRALFTQLDTDRNGALSPQEFERIAGPTPTVNVQPLITKMDTNKDQLITSSEYRAGAATDFDRLDVNKDGLLSQAEARTGNRPVR
jgi:Ca2+-binding EF-hand superfamily protein